MEPDCSLLERVFSLLRQDWVWDFFFTSASAELDMIRHAVDKEGVSTAEMNITTEGGVAAPGPSCEAFQVSERHRVLLMPSFAAGPITVGFAISERIASSATIVSRERYLGRFVRDDDNGTCTFISEEYNDKITEISYFTLNTPAHRENIFALVQRKRFRRIMNAFKKTGRYDADTLRAALLYFYYATEVRPCPTCKRDAAENCHCKLAIRRKMHPMDAEGELSNLVSYVGGYKGVANVGLFARGETFFQATYASESCTRLIVDPEMQRRLGFWALCSSARRRPVNPLAFCMGRGGLRGHDAVSPLDTFLLASIADSVMEDEAREKNEAMGMSSDTDPGFGSSSVALLEDGHVDDDAPKDDGEASVVHSTAPSHSSMLALPEPASAVVRCSTPSESRAPAVPESSPAPSPSPAGRCDIQACVARALPPPSAQAVAVVPGLPGECGTPLPSGNAGSAGGAGPWRVPKREVEVSESSVRGASSRSSGSEAGVGRERRGIVTRIAPAPVQARYILPSTAAAAAVSGGVVKGMAAGDMDERRRKAELRKARNRESAQRSNHKRKLRIQALKDDIAAAASREMYLRAKEKMLREENRSLRRTMMSQ